MPAGTLTTYDPDLAPQAPLDLHKGIWEPGALKGCDRWPEDLRLESSLGQLVKGRCKATNLCAYCRVLAVVETSEMLWLDAVEYAPTLWMVLTSREHLTRPDTYAHLKAMRLAARRRWPDCEWHVQIEFQKRGALHLNLLIKGVPVEDAEALYGVTTGVWCRRVDAVAGPFTNQRRGGQTLQEISAAGGLVQYLQKELSHGLKREQAPPLGWKGHRTSQTRGYLVRPAKVMREEARAALRLKREIWKLLRDHPHLDMEPDLVDQIVQAKLDGDHELEWTLVRVQRVPTAFDEQDRPTAHEVLILPVGAP